MGYATANEVRTRGAYDDPPFTDAYVDPWIDWATLFIDKVTGWWFEVREFGEGNELKLDGMGTRDLLVPLPIIEITKVQFVDFPTIPGGVSEVDLDAFAFYNRHLTIGLTNPDDRRNPRIAFVGTKIGRRQIFVSEFPRGRQNVWLTGKFGFTEWDNGVTPEGITPPLIKDVAIRLVLREMPPPDTPGGVIDGDQYEDRMRAAGRITQERVRDQSISYAAGARGGEGNIAGVFTNDPYIDMILASHRRPAKMASTVGEEIVSDP